MNETEIAALKARADADEPAALFAYSEYLRATDYAEADKYLTLAAQLGYPFAAEKLGDKYFDAQDFEHAAQYFKVGAKAGLSDCAVKLAVMKLGDNETAALRELEELAESGVKSACSALAAYYKSQGNRKEHVFWRSLAK